MAAGRARPFRGRLLQASCVLVVSIAAPCFATEYEVGPERAYSNISDVPWESLEPGDIVRIHCRDEPYREKWVICRRGTEEKPITVRGVPGPDGRLPVIDGRNAVTRRGLDFWNEERGVLEIGGASIPKDTNPAYIVVENLDIRSARPPYTFVDDKGSEQTYAKNAAPLYVEKGEHIVIRNCVIRDGGNGLFVGPIATDVLVEKCRIHDNGIDGSGFHHNVYSSADGMIFQYNRLGPMREGTLGDNLKDRSAGLVIRYNWIEGGNRNLDIVDRNTEKYPVEISKYRETFVYGNVILEPEDEPGTGHIVHYGGDSKNMEFYRKGTLHFYNNTIVSRKRGNTLLFNVSSNEECVDCTNNIVCLPNGGDLALLASAGVLSISHTWFQKGWRLSFERCTGSVRDEKAVIAGEDPGSVDQAGGDFHLCSDSPCIHAGGELGAGVIRGNVPDKEYKRHRACKTRALDGRIDLGAFEFSTAQEDGREVEAPPGPAPKPDAATGSARGHAADR